MALDRSCLVLSVSACGLEIKALDETPIYTALFLGEERICLTDC